MNTQEPQAVKKTYPQNWVAYNAAQTNEKSEFLTLLHDLCGGVQTFRQASGRPRLEARDIIFAACFKIYSTFSGRRFMTDLRAARDAGYISRAPHFNSIFNCLQNPALTPILKQMIVTTSLPLKSIETDFAVDSSGISTSKFIRWAEHRNLQRQTVHKGHSWIKIHIMIGVKTNIVTAIEILERYTNDTVPFPDLVDSTAENFEIGEVSADKAYTSMYNFKVVDEYGGVPFIPFKTNSTPFGNEIWNKMYHYFHYKSDEFKRHYHKRSNVESTFSMIKRKFGDAVRSKTHVAQINECLCKIICHNICVLIHEMRELGIDPVFENMNSYYR